MDSHLCSQRSIPMFHSVRCDPSRNRPCRQDSCASGQPKEKSTSSGAICIPSGPFRQVLDPRGARVQRWNRIVLLARGIALAIDPLFFYVISLSKSGAPCFYMDVKLAIFVTLVRTCLDLVHLSYVLLQFRLAYLSTESMMVGCGKLVWDARAIVSHYLRSIKGFWLDVFVILPLPQVVIWLVAPKLLSEERIKLIMIILLITYLIQFLPQFYHNMYLLKKLQKVTGFIFGGVWWRFILNVVAYLIASHVAGGCWYVLATHRLVSCLQQRCEASKTCNLSMLCSNRDCYDGSEFTGSSLGSACNSRKLTRIKSLCLESDGPFDYGIYEPMLLVFSSNSLLNRILYPILWGLLNLSSFANNLQPTTNPVEVLFCCTITLAGMGLFVTLIGNIQTVLANKERMQLRFGDLEWWMRRRQLPSRMRERVRHFEFQRWMTMGGQDETELLRDLPDGLRREIKCYLYSDLVKKVPLFRMLDDLILDNICDRVKPLLFSKGENIVREGDLVQRMVFIVRGSVRRSQGYGEHILTTSLLETGSFFGDELLSWCLRRPFVDRLPVSSATFVCVQSIEAFGLDAYDLRYITGHFRYEFASERLKWTARYYSSNWQSWGAMVIQSAWRRFQAKTKSVRMQNVVAENKLRQFVDAFLSLRRHDHLE